MTTRTLRMPKGRVPVTSPLDQPSITQVKSQDEILNEKLAAAEKAGLVIDLSGSDQVTESESDGMLPDLATLSSYPIWLLG